MPDLLLSNLPAKLVREITEWATLRRTTPERAAVELLRIGLHVTSEEVQGPVRDALDVIKRVKRRGALGERQR